MRRPHPDISLYWGGNGLDIGYECPLDDCELGLYPIMPPEPGAQCAYQCSHSCRCNSAQRSAIQALRVALKFANDRLAKEAQDAQ